MRRIFINGNVYTFDPIKPFVQAVVVENGRFIDMGSTDDMLLQWGRSTSNVIQLNGCTVTPGLTDSHLHLAPLASSLLDLDLTNVTSKITMLEMIRLKADTLKEEEWLLGHGWNENLFIDGGIPTIEELDHLAPHCPLFLSRTCHHAYLVNSKALEICNYHPDMKLPEGGSIVVDEQTKNPTGLVLESASELFIEHIPNKTYAEWKGALRTIIHQAMEKGLTSVDTNDTGFIGSLDQTYNLYDELFNEEQLGLRCNLLIDHLFLDDLQKNGMYTGYGNDTLQIGAIKIFSDGALGRRTALLSEPYSDATDQYGEAMFDQETLFHIVKKARNLAMPVAVHTIGDQALENVLHILNQFPVVAYRDRIIHAQVLRDDLIHQLATPHRVVDIQPRFVASDFPWVQDRLGEKRMKKAYAWKSLRQSGVICAGGSDAPVEPIDPLLGIHAAVTRRNPGNDHHGYNPKEKLSMEEAFQLFTKWSAYATNEETIKGTITRGKLADMTVFSKDPFKMYDADELLETKVEMTIIGGEIKYQRGK